MRNNPTYWGSAAAGILFICPEDNTLFLTLRSPFVHMGRTWGVPGGSVLGESFQDSRGRGSSVTLDEDTFWRGACNEVMEECDLLPPGLSRDSVVEVITFQDGSFIYKTFVCTLTKAQKDAWTPKIQLNWENTDFGWFRFGEEQDLPLHVGVVYALEEFKKTPSGPRSNPSRRRTRWL